MLSGALEAFTGREEGAGSGTTNARSFDFTHEFAVDFRRYHANTGLGHNEAPNPDPEMATNQCERCGAKLDTNQSHCAACGAPAPPGMAAATAGRQPRKTALRWVLVGAAAVLVLALWFARKFVPEPSDDRAPSRASLVEALEVARSNASRGDAEAQARLGQAYAEGRGVVRDYRQAAQWYRQAALQDSAEAQYRLGELCEAGQGVELSQAEAVKWYRMAAEAGHAGALYALGVMCEFGRGMPKDQTEAATWYRMAADRGDGLAQYNLGQRYDLGIGVATDRIAAYQWLGLAAAQGLKDAAEARDKVKAKMSSDELAEARRRIAAFVPSKGGSRPPAATAPGR